MATPRTAQLVDEGGPAVEGRDIVLIACEFNPLQFQPAGLLLQIAAFFSVADDHQPPFGILLLDALPYFQQPVDAFVTSLESSGVENDLLFGRFRGFLCRQHRIEHRGKAFAGEIAAGKSRPADLSFEFVAVTRA